MVKLVWYDYHDNIYRDVIKLNPYDDGHSEYVQFYDGECWYTVKRSELKQKVV